MGDGTFGDKKDKEETKRKKETTQGETTC